MRFRVILNIKVLTKTLLNMPGREKENLDNLLHMSQILLLVSSYNQIFGKLSKYEYHKKGK